MAKTQIITTQIINNIIVWTEKHPVWTLLSYVVSIIAILRFVALDIPQIHNNIKNTIYPSNIYLELSERKIPLRSDPVVLNWPVAIKQNEPLDLRFALVQDNFNSPQITKIFITFPPQSDVLPIPYKQWTWERNNDRELTYFLDYSMSEPAVKGISYDLPAFVIKFKSLEKLVFKYSIKGNRIEPITRTFIILPEPKPYVILGANSYTNAVSGSVVIPTPFNSASPETVYNRTLYKLTTDTAKEKK